MRGDFIDDEGRTRRDAVARLRWLYGYQEGLERYLDQMSGNDPDVQAWRRIGERP